MYRTQRTDVARMSEAISGTDGSTQHPDIAALMRATADGIAVDGRHEKVRAGMRVFAEIKTGDRRVIEYLLSPVMQAANYSVRNRHAGFLWNAWTSSNWLSDARN